MLHMSGIYCCVCLQSFLVLAFWFYCLSQPSSIFCCFSLPAILSSPTSGFYCVRVKTVSFDKHANSVLAVLLLVCVSVREWVINSVWMRVAGCLWQYINSASHILIRACPCVCGLCVCTRVHRVRVCLFVCMCVCKCVSSHRSGRQCLARKHMSQSFITW